MEAGFFAVTVLLFSLAVLTMVVIVREVLPLISLDDRKALRTCWAGPVGLRTQLKRSRAIRKAWDEHVRLFPGGRKRVLFAVLFIAAFISVMGYPLWLALASR